MSSIIVVGFLLCTVLLRINAGGVHLIFDIFFFFFFFGGGGVYSRGAFTRGRRLLPNTERVTILNINVNDFVVSFYPKTGIILFAYALSVYSKEAFIKQEAARLDNWETGNIAALKYHPKQSYQCT